MRLALIVLGSVFLAGCVWPVATAPPPPQARGSWTGTLVRIELYDRDGKPYPAWVLQVQNGPQMTQKGVPDYRPPPNLEAVLLDAERQPLQMESDVPNQMVAVSGTMRPADIWIKGVGYVGPKPGYTQAISILVKGQPHAVPDASSIGAETGRR